MVRLPDGIVTVHLDDQRYRGAYYFRDDQLVVTAYGYRETAVDLAVLNGECGKAALNLAKLVLIDMIRGKAAEDDCAMPQFHPGLSLQGSTTAIIY